MEKEIYIDNIKETSLIISASKIDSVKMRDITKKAVRVYDKDSIGVAGAVGDMDMKDIEEAAKINLKNNISYPYEISKDLSVNVDASKKLFSEKEFVKEGEELIKKLSEENNDFIFSNKISLMERNTSLSNSKNLDLKYRDKCVALEIIFKEKASTNIFDGFVGYEGRDYDREEFLKASREYLKAYKNQVELPHEGKLPVMVSLDSEGSLFTKMFSTDLNGRIYESKGSIFSGKKGEKLFSDDFTLYQTKNPEDVILEPFFDMEGTVNKNYTYALIENGVLKSPYTDKKTAKEFLVTNTGAASCDYDGVPTIAAPSFSIKKSDKTIKELLKGEVGVLVYVVSGGDFTAAGDFATPVQLAFLYDGEKIIGRLPQIQISSNIYKMYNEDFRGLSKDSMFKLYKNGLLIMDMDVKKM